MIKLEFLNGPLCGETRLYRHTPVRIGRGTGCDLVLDLDMQVSMNHAVLSVSEGQIILTDSAGGAPILVNGHPGERGPVYLEPGDILTLGETQLKLSWFDPPKPLKERRRSFLEWMALGAAAVILFAQVLFLLFLAPSWRVRVDVEVLRPTPTPVPVDLPHEVPFDIEEEPGVAVHSQGPDTDPEMDEEVSDPLQDPLVEPTPTPLPVPTPTSIPLTEDLTQDEQLERARELIRERRFLEADRLLSQIRDRYPDFLAAQVEYARLMGRQSRFQDSMDAWDIVETLAESGSAEAREAAIERPLMERRLRQLQRPVPTPLPPRVDQPPRQPSPPVAPPVDGRDRAIPSPLPEVMRPAPPLRPEVARNPSLLLQNIRVHRFADQSVADMREISFTLQHIFGSPAVPAGQIRIEARFFESDGERIFPADIPAQTVTPHVNQGLARGESLRDLKVIYQVPHRVRGPNSGSFYGVVLRAFSGTRLEHELSQPASLIQHMD